MRNLLLILFGAIMFVSSVRASDIYIDNVVVLLDCSGSMKESMTDSSGRDVRKIEAAKKAIYAVMETVDPETHVGVLLFSGEGYSNELIFPLGPKDDIRLKLVLDPVTPAGGTPLGEYIKRAGNILWEAQQKQHGYGTFRLLIVTDGEASDSELVARFTPEVRSCGITIDVIGVAMARNHMLASSSVVRSYWSANDPESLAKAVSDVFAEVPIKDFGADSVSDELDGLPSEIAAVMLKTISEPRDYPIGGTPPVRTKVVNSNSPTASSPDLQTQNPRVAEGSGTHTWVVIFLVIFVVVLIIFRGGASVRK